MKGYYEFGRAVTLQCLYQLWLEQFLTPHRHISRDNFLVALNNLTFPGLRYIEQQQAA